MVTKATLDYAYRRLLNICDERRVTRDPLEALVYENSFAQLPKQAGAPGPLSFRLRPDIVCLPRTPEEVSRVVLLGIELSIPVVPRGAASSTHGGGVCNVGGILMDLRVLNRVHPPDPDALTMTVEGGVNWKEASDYAAYKGLFLPVYPYFAGSATVGGALANGDVGIGALKYGPLAGRVRRLEVVLPTGELIWIGAEEISLGHRNYNVTTLLSGSEGTLGVITRATLEVLPMYEVLKPLAYAFGEPAAGAGALRALGNSGLTPYHVEFVDDIHLAIQRALLYQVAEAGGMVSVVLEGGKDAVAAETKTVDDLMASQGGVKQPDPVALEQWNERFIRYRGRRLSGGMVVNEVMVPLAKFPEALAGARRKAAGLKMDVAARAYLADRSSVVYTPYWLTDDRSLKSQVSLAFIKAFHDVVIELGGHPNGLGFLMAFNLDRMHGDEADTMRDIKGALDPQDMLNRGKLVSMRGRTPPLAPEEFFGEMPPALPIYMLKLAGGVKRMMRRDRYTPKPGRRKAAKGEEGE